MKGILTIFLGLKEDHYEKDVTQFGLNLSLHLKRSFTILVYENPNVNYEKFFASSIHIKYLPKLTSIATIDTIIFIILNAHRYSILQLFHLCRFTFIVAIFYKLMAILSLNKSITLLKADHNGLCPEQIKKKFSIVLRFVGLKGIDIATFETVNSFDDFSKSNIFYKVMHIPNGYYRMTGSSKKLMNKENILIFAGRISEYQKNAEEFLRAVPIFLRDNNSWSVHIFGVPDENLMRIIKYLFDENMDIAHRIHLRGFVPRLEFEDTLSKAKLLALTSRFEGYPALLVEARAWGLKVVSTEVNGIFDIANGSESFLIYKSGDVSELIKCLNISAKEDDYFREGIYIADRNNFVESNSWDLVTKPLAEYILKYPIITSL